MRLGTLIMLLIFASCARVSCTGKQIESSNKPSAQIKNRATNSSQESADNKIVISSKEIIIGALLDAHDAGSSRAQLTEKTIRLAEKDANQRLATLNQGLSLKVIIEHTQGNPDIARKKIEEFYKQGIRLVIGLENSGIIFATREYANFNGMILLSTSSTAPSLQIDNDNLFRLVPSDRKQTKVLAERMHELSKSKIYEISRNDVYGSDFHLELADALEQYASAIEFTVIYPPHQNEFGEYVKNIRWAVDEAIKNGAKPDTIAVHVSAYDEVASILAAANEPANRILKNIKWFGTDGVHDAQKLLQSNESIEYALNVGLEVTGLTVPKQAQSSLDALAMQLNAKSNEDFTLFVANFYDAIKLISETAFTFGTDLHKATVKNWRDSIETNSKNITGATGPLEFDEYGDRKLWAYGIYSLARVTENKFSWKLMKRVEASN